ncbi:hypothetical protein BSKO_09671 [Bryopsis sp. KO-2023]|nr:hypothetical protein BSKO_09671 [Bryopsis sp. KO-2023]
MWKWIRKLCCCGVEESAEVEQNQAKNHEIVEVELTVAEESYPSYLFSEVSISSLSSDAPPTPHTTPAFPWIEDEAIAAEMMDNGYNELFDAIQKEFAAYLEKKRLYFPRFSFLASDEMLEILSETENPTRVQPHVKKCFEGVAELHSKKNVTSIKSVKQEQVPFENLVDTAEDRGSVEKWLLEVEAAMFKSVHNTTALGIKNWAAKHRNYWVLEGSGMVILVIIALHWTKGAEKEIQERCVKQHEDLLKNVDSVPGKPTKLQRATLGALVVMDVHARDVVTTLAAKGIDNIADFECQEQLKSYWDKEGSGEKDFATLKRLMSAIPEYGYEDLGNSSRLVIAPQIDSVVAHQVLDIHKAKAARLTVFTFEGKELQLKARCAITINLGYAGRSELPDNLKVMYLKALLRMAAMMLPDYAMISEIRLFPFGYPQARECAKKIVQCCKLCPEQLSSKNHYDNETALGDACNEMKLQPEEYSVLKELSSPLFAATFGVYFTAMSQLLPTPAKSYCTFNLGDIPRLGNGLLIMKPLRKGGATKDLYLRLWKHEILRVFYDRVVDEKDQQWFLSALKQTTATSLNTDFDKLFKHVLQQVANEANIPDTESIRKCFFGDYKNQEAEEPSLIPCSEVIDFAPLISKMEECLVDHKSTGKQAMNLAMFLYAVKHVLRVYRVLKQPGAHMLCVGLGGSGRKSLSRLGAYICGMETFQIEVSENCTTIEWSEDLKKMTRRAGGACVFLTSDTQIKGESFVEDINCLLNAGEFPSLVNCCRIECFQKWPTDALEGGAIKFLQEIENMAKEERHVQIMDMCKMFPQDIVGLSDKFRSQSGRINYVAPTSYLELITFAALLAQKRTEISAAKKRCEMGLEKLEFTVKQVNIMQNEPSALKPTLAKMVSKTGQLMATVQKGKTVVSTSSPLAFWSPVTMAKPKRALVDEEVKKAEAAAEAAKTIKMEFQEDLAEEIPVLEGAFQVATLHTIKPTDIILVLSFRTNMNDTPPGATKLVIEAVCVLLNVKPTRIKNPSRSRKKIDDYWEPLKRLLGDPQFVVRLQEYDKENVPPKIMERISKNYTSNPDFTPAKAAKAFSAAEDLCKWTCAMDDFDKLVKVVAPKKATPADAEGQYNEVMTALQAKEAEIMDKMGTLEQQLDRSVKQKTRLEDEVDFCTKKLERAEKLIGGLGGERFRWTESTTMLGDVYLKLTGDMLISVGVNSYLGAYTMALQEILIDQVTTKWVASKSKEIPSSPSFSQSKALGDPVIIRAWGIAGLPNNSFSLYNGIMVAYARGWCPHTQVRKQIKEKEAVAEQTQHEIAEAPTGYKPCGVYNAVLFLCIRDMAAKCSLAWFIGLFVRYIRGSEKSEDLLNINDHFTYSFYTSICLSLFENDKVLFAFLLNARYTAFFLTYIDALLSYPIHEVFGLQENANITKDLQETDMMSTLLMTGGAGGGGGGENEEELVGPMVEDILNTLPAKFDKEKARAKFPVEYEDP